MGLAPRENLRKALRHAWQTLKQKPTNRTNPPLNPLTDCGFCAILGAY